MLKSRTCRVSLSIFKDALASVRTFNSSFGDWKRAANVRALQFHGNSPLTSESNSLCFYEVQLSKFDWKDVLHENINETRNAWFGHAFIRRRFATDDGRKLICPLTAHLSRETSWDNTFALSKLARSEMIKSHIKSLIDENGQFSDYCRQEYIPPNQPKPFSHCYLHGQHGMEVNKSGFAGRNELHLKDGGKLRCIAKHWNVHHRQIDFYERALSFNREAIHMNSSCKIKVSLFSTRATTLLATLRRSETIATLDILQRRAYSSDAPCGSNKPAAPEVRDHSQRAVVTALWCNLLVLMLKCGVWLTTASHVMLAEAVHSLADLANQALLAYGLISSKRAPDALHPYGYSKERFVWSLISAVGIFCLGSGATIVHGVTNLWNAQPIHSMLSAVIVIVGSMVMEGASLVVAVNAVRKGAAAEGMKWQEYVWRGHDPTAVAVMMEDSAAVAGLLIAGIALATVSITGNPIWDPIGSILVGNLLGVVAIFLIQRNRHALLGRSMDTADMQRVMNLLSFDPVVDAVYDCKSEVIGPGAYRFKAEIDFNGVVIVQNYLQRAGREAWMGEFREAVKDPNNSTLERVLAIYGEEVVAALGSEVDRLEKEIQKLVPGIRHVDIEAHNPKGALP